MNGMKRLSPCLFNLLSPCLFNVYVDYIIRSAGLDESHAGIKIARRNINNLSYADDTILMEESEEELKSLLMWVKEESKKAGLKFNIQKTKIMASGHITSWQIEEEKVEAMIDFLFLGSKITADVDCSHEIKTLAPWKKNHDKPRQHIKKQWCNFDNKGPYRQSYGFSSGHVWMWELDHKEGWVPKTWCFWIAVLENIESPLECKEMKSVSPKGNQSRTFTGRIDAGADIPILWSPDEKSQLIGKDPDAG